MSSIECNTRSCTDLNLKSSLTQREERCRDIILRAGEIASKAFGQQAKTITLKGPQDYLTETDAAVEDFIRQELAASFPNDAVLGEESGGAEADITWVVDPIDGTANFARGIPHYCICIALVMHRRVELGVIYQPESKELYVARHGNGARRNGEAIRVSLPAPVEACTVELGWSTRIPSVDYLQVMENLLKAGLNVRRSACGALGLAWVADGRSDAYVELHMNPWDCLAGLLLVQEAGGVVNQALSGLPRIGAGPVLAATPELASAMMAASGISLAPFHDEPGLV
ncbi:MAG: inositol monophosphatase [Saccharospirillum sp.]|nr:inositol monophosphatase [Saccharospirillum sp.]